MTFDGRHLIDGRFQAAGKERFQIVDAATTETLEGAFVHAVESDIDQACTLAAQAFPLYSALSLETRAAFLDTIATEIDAIVDDLVVRIGQEAGLPEARVRGETGRTSGQLRLFAKVLRRGDYLQARIDTALPDRQPLPRPDIRQYNQALGPVAVFGASNFPMAFSVAGGDTASALAAGCPVVVRAHSGHPGTAELVGKAVVRAIEKCALPRGVFSLIQGKGHHIGGALVKHPAIKAVGFTGSLGGGRALCDAAASRPEPIPVYAEMGSINPVFLLPQALATNADKLAEDFVASLTMGTGQFCTNPGLVIAAKGEGLDRFRTKVAELIADAPAGVMLNAGTLSSYNRQQDKYRAEAELIGEGHKADNRASTSLFGTELASWQSNDVLHEEAFGPCSLLVETTSPEAFITAAEKLDGQLTATLWSAEGELESYQPLLNELSRKVGRILVNGFPTGVEVCDAMTHGGPYPACSIAGSTSVGTRAVERFVRPVSFQSLPDACLPDALKNANPLGILRLVNGEPSTAPIA
ncbi:MAG: aldehyde dehydrogenase (NADP(+)) [Oceanospirillales bacterium]|nr:aldehyde dehydrogenase (NADP(+)) [Oceanospirillales bacterium]